VSTDFSKLAGRAAMAIGQKAERFGEVAQAMMTHRPRPLPIVRPPKP